MPFDERGRGGESAASRACDGHPDGEPVAGHEGGDPVAPDRLAAVMAGQMDVGVPAAGDRKTVQRNPLAGRQRDSFQAVAPPGRRHAAAHQGPGARHLGDGLAIPHVDNRCDLDSLPGEIGGRAPAVVIVGEDADAPPGADGEPVGVGAHRTGQHHARPVVAAEGDRPLGGAGGEYRPLAVNPPQDLARLAVGGGQMVGPALQGAVDAVVVGAGDRGPQEETDPVHGRQFAHGLGSPVCAGPTVHFMGLGVEPPAHDEILIRQYDPRAAAPGGQSGGKPGRARADNQQVAMQEPLVVAVRVGLAGQAAEPGGRPDGRLIDLLPEGFRPHEGLVIEAGRQEGGEQVVDRQQVAAQRTAIVLAEGLQPVEQLRDGRSCVRLAPGAAAQLDQCVGFLRSGGEDAPGPVVFEAPANQPDLVGEQGRGQRVAGMARKATAVEPEIEAHAPVDPAAVEAERPAHRSRPRAMAISRASSTLRTSWVSVLRVTTSQDRSPCSWNHSSRCSPAGLSRRCR